MKKNLETNLFHLYKEIKMAISPEKNTSTYFQSNDFLGTCTFCGKSYELINEKEPLFQFRLMAHPSIAFHVLSSLWLNKIGCIFDKRLSNDHLFVNRLRRTKESALNPNALGNFVPYSHQYQKWQDNALEIIQQELEAERNVASVCLDIKSFYYSINPSFLADKEYIEEIEATTLPEKECLVAFHRLFVKILQNWDTNFPELRKSVGIPVGLPASGLLANLALGTFDKIVINELRPLYYGRYVDDIIIILKDDEEDKDNRVIKDIESFFNFLIAHASSHFIQNTKGANVQWEFIDPSGNFLFNKKKQQFLEFKKPQGTVRLQLFRNKLAERTSEWRALPNLPPANLIFTKIIKILDSQEPGLHFKDSSNLSVMRSRFCFVLRDCEVFARTFSPDIWADTRKAFLKTFADFIIDAPNFFNFEKYLNRVLVLGVLGEDYQEIAIIIDRIGQLILEFKKHDCIIAGFDINEKCTKENQKGLIINNYSIYINSIICAALTQSNPDFKIEELKRLLKDGKEIENACCKNNKFEDFFLHDLAAFPVKSLLISNEQTPLTLYSFGNVILQKCYFDKPFTLPVVEMFQIIIKENQDTSIQIFNGTEVQWSEKTFWCFFRFNTRPMTEYDMYFMLDALPPISEDSKNPNKQDLGQHKEFNLSLFINLLQYFRGYSKKIDEHCFEVREGLCYIPNAEDSIGKCSIAIACISMEEEKLKLVLGHQIDGNSLNRYKRFTKIVNEILSASEKIDYLVFPELALPPRWFIEAAHKLKKKGISFISGIEYLSYGDKIVSNQVWMALKHTMFDYNSYVIIRQRKQYPAYRELATIRKETHLEWIPELSDRKKIETMWPIVIKHGEFFFSVLVCAELMNIQYRNNLRGKIDCLFVPEWNQDTTSFNDLVNASSLDLHAFIVQCNNNKYGDCRLRGPFKKEFMKDIVNAKGGKNDYFIIGEIDFDVLRKYQLSVAPDDGSEALFKPFPIGFTMSKERKRKYLKKEYMANPVNKME